MKKKTTKRTLSEKQMSAELDAALAAPYSDAKVPISIKLDSDIYIELKRRAGAGEAKGKYQTLLNQLLRESLFGKEAVTVSLKELERRVRRLEAIRFK